MPPGSVQVIAAPPTLSGATDHMDEGWEYPILRLSRSVFVPGACEMESLKIGLAFGSNSGILKLWQPPKKKLKPPTRDGVTVEAVEEKVHKSPSHHTPISWLQSTPEEDLVHRIYGKAVAGSAKALNQVTYVDALGECVRRSFLLLTFVFSLIFLRA